MDNNDKKLIINYIIKERLYFILTLLAFVAIVLLVNIDSQIKLFISFFLGLGLGIVLFSLVFKILFIVCSKNIKLTDGYICERKHYYDSDSINRFYGKAKTLDGNKITKSQSIPMDFVSGQIPVKILVNNGNAKRFFITKESYAYIKEQHEKLGQKNKNNYTIIKIILVILALIFIIMLFKNTFVK